MVADNSDIRTLFEPARDVPNWFWDKIDQGGQNRVRFREVARQMEKVELDRFIQLIDEMANLFIHAPFHPPFHSLSAYLEETGYWVISQGKDFFNRVWQDPSLFWDLKRNNVIELQSEQSYFGIPELVWSERFPEEDIPGHRQDE